MEVDGASRGTLGRQERGRETRRKLIHAATRRWSERGFDRVTVEEICAAAGVGRTTFYLHFESKEQLLASLAGATAAGVAADLDSVRATGSLPAQLDAFVCGVARRMEGVPQSLAELVIHSWRAAALGRGPDAMAGSTRFADLLRDVLTDARARRELDPAADPVELGEILGALTMDAIEAWSGGRTGRRRLVTVLRSRFAVVVDQYRTG